MLKDRTDIPIDTRVLFTGRVDASPDGVAADYDKWTGCVPFWFDMKKPKYMTVSEFLTDVGINIATRKKIIKEVDITQADIKCKEKLFHYQRLMEFDKFVVATFGVNHTHPIYQEYMKKNFPEINELRLGLMRQANAVLKKATLMTLNGCRDIKDIIWLYTFATSTFMFHIVNKYFDDNMMAQDTQPNDAEFGFNDRDFGRAMRTWWTNQPAFGFGDMTKYEDWGFVFPNDTTTYMENVMVFAANSPHGKLWKKAAFVWPV